MKFNYTTPKGSNVELQFDKDSGKLLLLHPKTGQLVHLNRHACVYKFAGLGDQWAHAAMDRSVHVLAPKENPEYVAFMAAVETEHARYIERRMVEKRNQIEKVLPYGPALFDLWCKIDSAAYHNEMTVAETHQNGFSKGAMINATALREQLAEDAQKDMKSTIWARIQTVAMLSDKERSAQDALESGASLDEVMAILGGHATYRPDELARWAGYAQP